MKMKQLRFFIFLIVSRPLIAAEGPASIQQTEGLSFGPTHVLSQPDGPFVLLYSNADAVGSYSAIAYWKYDHSKVPLEWDFGNRFWDGEEWGKSVKSILWIGTSFAVVSTDSIYGEGKIYFLNLKDRKSKIIGDVRTKFQVHRIILNKFDEVKNELTYTIYESGESVNKMPTIKTKKLHIDLPIDSTSKPVVPKTK